MREGIHTSVGKFFQKEDSGNICTRGHLLSRWALADKSWSPAAAAPWERTSKSTLFPTSPSSFQAEASFSAFHPWLCWVRNWSHPSEPPFSALAAQSLLICSLGAARWQLFHRAKDPSPLFFPTSLAKQTMTPYKIPPGSAVWEMQIHGKLSRRQF